MASPAYLPLYVDDYDAATMHLTPAEDGIYFRLLRLCWRQPTGNIPSDRAWIMRRARVDLDTFETLVEPILEEFFTLARGRYSQGRLQREFDKSQAISEARKSAGQRGGNAKASKSLEESPSKPDGKPESKTPSKNVAKNDIARDSRPDHTRKEESKNLSTSDSTTREAPRGVPADIEKLPADKKGWAILARYLTTQTDASEATAKSFIGKTVRDNSLDHFQMIELGEAAWARTDHAGARNFMVAKAREISGRKIRPAFDDDNSAEDGEESEYAREYRLAEQQRQWRGIGEGAQNRAVVEWLNAGTWDSARFGPEPLQRGSRCISAAGIREAMRDQAQYVSEVGAARAAELIR